MSPGQTFTKTWRLENCGKSAWGEDTKLVFANGVLLGATSPVHVGNVAPGEKIEISVDMTAHSQMGEYKSEWALHAADGTIMIYIYVLIVVASGQPTSSGQDIKIESVNVNGVTETFYLPCGSAIPSGAVCVCNCVASAAPCSCDGVCSCDGHTTCTCDSVHYWYPN